MNTRATSRLGQQTLRSLGKAIAHRRRALKVSRQSLAKELKISVESMRQIEEGLYNIDVIKLTRIAKALKSVVSELLVSRRRTR